MSGGGNSGQQSGVSANYMLNGPGGGGSMPDAASSAQQVPQWLRGLQLGQQISQAGQRPPLQPMQHPMMGGAGMPGGMPSNVVPGSQGMMPPPPQSPGMMTGGQGMPMGGQPGGVNPQLLQMLLRSQQR